MAHAHLAIRRGRHAGTRGSILASVVSLAFASVLAAPAAANIVVIDYENADPVDFRTEPYLEDGTRTDVHTGHYEIIADGSPTTGGDQAFNVDEQSFGLSTVRVTVEGGYLFDVVSLEVVNPADSVGEYVFSAVGGEGGSVAAPTAAGPFEPGAGFLGVAAFDITQAAPGAFAMDDLTLRVMPEPAAIPTLVASALLLAALRRRGA